jgi:hypothetical protein
MATPTVIITVAMLISSFGSLSVRPDECPRAILTCERSTSDDAEYTCTAIANQPSVDDAPQYSWKLSAGKIVGDPKAPNITVDARGVKSDELTVTLNVKWPKSPPGCEASERERIKLR